MSFANDKRIIASDQINIYARGHFRLQSDFDNFFMETDDDIFLNIDIEYIEFLKDSSDDEYLMNVDV